MYTVSCDYSIPNEAEMLQGEIKQDDKCLDTLGNQHLGNVMMYRCHGGGGNQVRIIFKDILILVILIGLGNSPKFSK